jgi:predicted HicB family RNase H-like nuclease
MTKQTEPSYVTFPIKLSKELHKRLKIAAAKRGVTLTEVILEALRGVS